MNRKCPKTSHDQDEHHDDTAICFHLAKTGYYIQELHRIGLWPIPNLDTAKSIQDVSDRLLKICNYSAVDLCEAGMCCDEANIDFEEHLLQVTETISKCNTGLCLNCVKKGKIMSADGNCRAASLELCKNLF